MRQIKQRMVAIMLIAVLVMAISEVRPVNAAEIDIQEAVEVVNDRELMAPLNFPLRLGMAQRVGLAGREWYVVGTKSNGLDRHDDEVTLFLKGELQKMQSHVVADVSDDYTDSMLRKYLAEAGNDTGYTGVSFLSALLPVERVLLKPTDLQLKGVPNVSQNLPAVEYPKLSGDKIWSMSSAEISVLQNSDAVDIVDIDPNVYKSSYWLRSPSIPTKPASDKKVLNGVTSGAINLSGIDSTSAGVRPALRLDLSTVLLTSEAVKGKSNVGDALAEVVKPQGTVKFTAVDPSFAKQFAVAKADSEAIKSGDTVVSGIGKPFELQYSHGEVDSKAHYVSMMINSEVEPSKVYYGRLNKISDDSLSGKTQLNQLGGKTLAAGRYQVKVWQEAEGGDNYTDTASEPFAFTLLIQDGAAESELNVLTALPAELPIVGGSVQVTIKGKLLPEVLSVAAYAADGSVVEAQPTQGTAEERQAVLNIPGNQGKTEAAVYNIRMALDGQRYDDQAQAPQVIVAKEAAILPPVVPNDPPPPSGGGGGSIDYAGDVTTDTEQTVVERWAELSEKEQQSIKQHFAQEIPYTILVERLKTISFRNWTDDQFTTKQLETIEKGPTILKALGIELPWEIVTLQPKMDLRFNDVTAQHWATKEIMAMARLGVAAGYEDNTFRPDQQLGVWDNFVFIDRLLLLKNYNQTDLPRSMVEQYFSDRQHWAFYPAASIASKLQEETLADVMQQPDQHLNRGMLAQVLFEAIGGTLPRINPLVHFEDVDDSPYLAGITYCVQAGLLKGVSATEMAPEQGVTRAEMMVVLGRLYEMSSNR